MFRFDGDEIARERSGDAAVGPAGDRPVRAFPNDLNRIVARPVDRVDEGHRDDHDFGFRSGRTGPGEVHFAEVGVEVSRPSC